MKALTENMKIWLKKLYLDAAEEHLGAASNEHLWAIGAPTGEAATLHEMNAEEHREFAEILKSMASKIEEDK